MYDESTRFDSSAWFYKYKYNDMYIYIYLSGNIVDLDELKN